MAVSLDELLKQGIAAAQTGQARRARDLLLRAIQADDQSVQAWYWLSGVVESAEEREICLENVLTLDPGHTVVQAELAALRRQMAQARHAQVAVPVTPDEWLASDTALVALPCPYCGADTTPAGRDCPACGRSLYTRRRKRKDHSVYSLLLVFSWFSIASYIWLGMTFSYLFQGLCSVADPASGLVAGFACPGGLAREAAGRFLGLEGGAARAFSPPLASLMLAGGAAFLFSLVVAGGLYLRLRFFYWLTLGMICLGFLATLYQAAAAETLQPTRLVISAALFFLTLGLAFLAHDEFAWEEERLAAVADRDVDTHSALYARGRDYARQGMWARAAAQWAKAVALSPGQPDYRLALASAYVNLGQSGRAREHLLAAQQHDPDNPQLRQLLRTVQEAA